VIPVWRACNVGVTAAVEAEAEPLP